MPRMATKPSGLLNRNRAPTTPIRPIGTTQSTMNSLPKLCNCAIRNETIRNSMIGTTAITDCSDCALSSTTPPTAML